MGLLTLVDGQSKRRPNLKTVEKIMRNLHQNLSHVISQLLKRKKDLWRAVTACVLMRDGIKNSRGSLSSDLDQWQLSRLSYFYITSIKDLANPLHLISLRDVTLKLSFISFPWAQYPFFFLCSILDSHSPVLLADLLPACMAYWWVPFLIPKTPSFTSLE